MGGLGVLAIVGGILVAIVVGGALILLLVLLIVRKTGGGMDALAQRYPAYGPVTEGLLTKQIVQIGAVRWRRAMSVGITTQGLYLEVTGALTAIRATPQPCLVPWSELRTGARRSIYLNVPGVELHAGNPKVATIILPTVLYEQVRPYLSA